MGNLKYYTVFKGKNEIVKHQTNTTRGSQCRLKRKCMKQ